MAGSPLHADVMAASPLHADDMPVSSPHADGGPSKPTVHETPGLAYKPAARPIKLLVQVSRSVLEDVSAHFPPSGKTYPLAISRLFGGQRTFTFHICNASTPSSPTAVNLILASDADDPGNDVILSDLDNKTLSIFGNHTGDRFEITRISAVHRRVGTGSNRALTTRLSLHLKPGPGVSCVSPAFYRQIAALPNNRTQTAVNNQRIEHWDKYLEINENIARSAQVVVRYSRQRALAANMQLVFTMAEDGIIPKHAGSNIQLVTDESVEDGQSVYQGPQLGTIRTYDAQKSELTVDMDVDFYTLWNEGRYVIPASARLFVSKIGDLVQIRRLRNGLKAFARGQAENRRLDVFMFDATQARLPGPDGGVDAVVRLGDADLLQPGLNPEQRQAVEGALNSPDLFLIQGPPGTGKTTVIAEICYQNAIRGQRTLIASQTNLAVDNALGKLVHHPKIRALRKGNEASVQAEGMLFVENRVIGTWLQKTAAASTRKQAELAAEAARLENSRQQLPDIVWVYRNHHELRRWLHVNEPVINELQRKNAALDSEYRLLRDAFERFMTDPAGPAFNVLSANAAKFDTQTLILIGRINAAAVQYGRERRQVDADAARFRVICLDLDRLATAVQTRLKRISQWPGRASDRSARAGHTKRASDRSARAAATGEPAARLDSVTLLRESGFDFTLDDFVQQGERLRRELIRINRKAPGFFRILFGRTGEWAALAADRSAMARYLSASRDRVVHAEVARVETLFDNPDMTSAIRTLTDTFRNIRESLLMSLNGNLSEIDSLQEQISRARHLQQEGQQRVEAFHADLRPQIQLASFETILADDHLADGRHMDDHMDSRNDNHIENRMDSRGSVDRIAMSDPLGCREGAPAGTLNGSGDESGDKPGATDGDAGSGALETAVMAIYGRAFAVAEQRLAAHQTLVSAWSARIGEPNADDAAALKQLYIDHANVIGITCNQSGSYDFSQQYPAFDVAIIDEVSKATPPELILAVLKAKKIVLVGDHKQLPPMVGMETYEEIARQFDIPETETEHMKTGLFEELYTQAPQPLRLMLSTQYRMHPQIMDTINQFYAEANETGLRCGIADPDERRQHYCHGQAIARGDHALWVDIPQTWANREQRSDTSFSYANPAETACIRQILRTISANLRANDPAANKKVGIISFYSGQVRLLEKELLNPAFAAEVANLILRIGSVDRFQGIECPIVICSFVRNNDRGDIGFAKDPRRVNVALSRAQELSVIVGCRDLFCATGSSGAATGIYGTIAERIHEHGGFRNELDFG